MYVGDDESFSHKMTMKENKLNQKPKIPEKEFHSNEQIILLYCCCFFQFGTYSRRIKQKPKRNKRLTTLRWGWGGGSCTIGWMVVGLDGWRSSSSSIVRLVQSHFFSIYNTHTHTRMVFYFNDADEFTSLRKMSAAK